MTRLAFLILAVFVSLSHTTGIKAIHAHETSSYSHPICIYSVIICLSDRLQQKEAEGLDNEKLIYSALNQINSTKLENWIDDLSSFYTRHTKSEYIESVAYWLKNGLQSACQWGSCSSRTS